MKSFAVNRNNDVYRDPRGNLAMSTGLDALLQNLEHVMQSLFGEMVFALPRGLPYQETVWGGTPNVRLFEAHARRRLLAEPGVEAIEHFSATQDGDTLRYAVAVRTQYGHGQLDGFLQAMRGRI